jgi:LmbE family N-acetylglucosaminyl deacetylase
MKNRVLVVAVHPDDETLGCGGSLLKHKAGGDDIYWLICTGMHEKDGFKKDDINKREKEIETVAEMYGFNGTHKLGLSTMKVDECSISDLVSRISKVMIEVKPNIVYLPFNGDAHSDHRKIFEAAYSCTKNFRYPFVKKIYMMETLSETEFAPNTKENNFVPNVFVDITGFFETKLEIMRVFNGEMGEHPFPRSERNMRALATLRGATGGCEYAESFALLKEVI